MKDLIVYQEVGKKPVKKYVDLMDIKELQQLVGGYIETIPMANGILLVCNEEGMIKNLPVNMVFANNVIHGNAFYCAFDSEDFAGLTEEQADWILSFN
ncbi:MAG: DUF3846 domain-containing protein [Clostridium sp.]|uniref:DUF3846 domain-containing protein n=1 Tax=Clostridium sp. TaxID=1506 RepID=UPI003F3676BC